uniref:Elongation factor 1-delta n=1 Tax=Vombatus ursinus TaxID=29139 RepID=A0A4X2LVK7_VOMUR
MATSFLLHEKIWFDKCKYDDAERKFYYQAEPGPSANVSFSSGPHRDHSELVTRISSLEAEKKSLRSVIQDLQLFISKLEIWLFTLEKCSPSHHFLAPQTQQYPLYRRWSYLPHHLLRRRPLQHRMMRKMMILTCLVGMMRKKTRKQPSLEGAWAIRREEGQEARADCKVFQTPRCQALR